MTFFEDAVEKTSSESLRDMMARILAGEIRRPGTISRMSIQAVTVMDQAMAQALWNIRPWLLPGGLLPTVGHFASPAGQVELALLDSASLVRVGSGAQHMQLNHDKEAFFSYSDSHGFVLTWDLNFDVPQWGVVNLSPIGQELLNVLPPDERKNGRNLAVACKEIRFMKKVEWCSAEMRDNLWFITSREEV